MTEGSILVIADESNMSRALRITLAANGFQVMNTQSVDEALDLNRGRRCDLVLLDSDTLPAAGVESCRRIRAKSDAAIIVMSAGNSKENRIQAIQAGANDYIPKPFGISEILTCIRANLSKDEKAVLAS